MGTRREYERAAFKEFEMLNRAWFEEYIDVPDAEGKAQEDTSHMPPALYRLIVNIIEEGVGHINKGLHERHADGTLEPGDATFDEAMTLFGHLSVMLAGRMYRLGEKMATKLPVSKMQPCPCSVVTDEDFTSIESFLKEAAEATTQPANPKDDDIVFGDGWVITSFGSKKE